MEKYARVKFRVELCRKEVPSDERIKELSYWCREFHSHGLTPLQEGKSAGNLSFRLREGAKNFIITASGLGPKGSLTAKCFVEVSGCSIDKNVVYASGLREPSSESILHCRIYELREDVNAIFHGHDPAILKNANNLGLVETKEWHPYGSIELVRGVENVLGENNFIVMKKHGFISLGRGKDAMKMAGMLALEKHKAALQKKD